MISWIKASELAMTTTWSTIAYAPALRLPEVGFVDVDGRPWRKAKGQGSGRGGANHRQPRGRNQEAAMASPRCARGRGRWQAWVGRAVSQVVGRLRNLRRRWVDLVVHRRYASQHQLRRS